MIHPFDIYDLRDAFDAEFEGPSGLSDEIIDRCRAKAKDLAGRIAGYQEEAAALFFILCTTCGADDFAIVVVARVGSDNNVHLGAVDLRDLAFLAEDVMYSHKEYADVLRWFEDRLRLRR